MTARLMTIDEMNDAIALMFSMVLPLFNELSYSEFE